MIDALREFTEQLPVRLQWVGIMVTAAIPFLEVEVAAALGVLTGMPVVIAILAAVVGNVVTVAVIIQIALFTRSHWKRKSVSGQSPRMVKLRRSFDRYGVPGVSLLGPIILPTHFTSATMVSLGANARTVLIWQTIAIMLWGTTFALIATGGLALLH